MRNLPPWAADLRHQPAFEPAYRVGRLLAARGQQRGTIEATALLERKNVLSSSRRDQADRAYAQNGALQKAWDIANYIALQVSNTPIGLLGHSKPHLTGVVAPEELQEALIREVLRQKNDGHSPLETVSTLNQANLYSDVYQREEKEAEREEHPLSASDVAAAFLRQVLDAGRAAPVRLLEAAKTAFILKADQEPDLVTPEDFSALSLLNELLHERSKEERLRHYKHGDDRALEKPE
jgi:hypothetical protein